jgi:hypothetical protein
MAPQARPHASWLVNQSSHSTLCADAQPMVFQPASSAKGNLNPPPRPEKLKVVRLK